MLTLRPTTPADLPGLLRWEADPDTAIWLGETGRAWHERALIDPDQCHLTAEDAGAAAGFAVLAGLGNADNAIELRRMVISPDSRGAGRGRGLLRAVLAHARDNHGVAQVWLDVKAGNLRARTLYETEGFIGTPAIPGAAPETGKPVAGLLVMKRELAR